MAGLKVRRAKATRVYRVGFTPDAWAWSPWQYAPFTGRWDDPDGTYRVLYAGRSAYACYVEVLARFRVDDTLDADLNAIQGDTHHDARYPTIEVGVVPRSWAQPRFLGTASLSGNFVDVQHPDSVADLRPRFLRLARSLGLPDFDGGAIRQAEPRLLTKRVSSHLYVSEPESDGVLFESRHGNGLRLFAIFERARTTARSGRTSLLYQPRSSSIPTTSRDFRRALQLHKLTYR